MSEAAILELIEQLLTLVPQVITALENVHKAISTKNQPDPVVPDASATPPKV